MKDGTKHFEQRGTATGSWRIYDNGTTLSNKRYRQGQHGPSRYGCGTCNTTKEGNVSGTSFSSSPPSGWIPVSESSMTSVGVSMHATVKRGTETWTFNFYNNSNGSGL